ncbi:MAG: xylan 1,4-beta-xylosidase [Clostridiales bacterium]|nr:xylan 1,4-beta-xylosidase [Clostridiales bacterium]
MSKNVRFQRILCQGNFHINEIWVDTETGVQYLYHSTGHAGGLTPLLGPDGKPLMASLPVQKPEKES